MYENPLIIEKKIKGTNNLTKSTLYVEPREFTGEIAIKTVSTSNLCLLINQIFKLAFKDYEGCNVYFSDQTQTLKCTLFGRLSDKHDDLNMVQLGDYNKLELTDIAKEILSDFMDVIPNTEGDINPSDINWVYFVSEQPYIRTRMLCVKDISLCNILKKAYPSIDYNKDVKFEIEVNKNDKYTVKIKRTEYNKDR